MDPDLRVSSANAPKASKAGMLHYMNVQLKGDFVELLANSLVGHRCMVGKHPHISASNFLGGSVTLGQILLYRQHLYHSRGGIC